MAAVDIELQRLRCAFTLDSDLHARAGLTADMLDRSFSLHPLSAERARGDLLAVFVLIGFDFRDQVAGLESRLVSGAAFDRRHDQEGVLGGGTANLDADPFEL